MPATEETWYNLKKMHVVFAVSSFALFGATMWMMANDSNREWHGYQQKFAKLEAAKLENQEQSYETQLASGDLLKQSEQLNAQLKQAGQDIDAHRKEIDKIESEVAIIQGEFARADRAVKFERAKRDVARANYDIAIRDNEPKATRDALKKKFDDEEKEVQKLEVNMQDVTTRLADKQKELTARVGAKEAAQAGIKKLHADIDRTEKALFKLQPKNSFAAFKRSMMEMPIIDGFNSPLKIQQDWLPDLLINYGGMRSVARFDHCRTCHLGIDRTEKGGVAAFPPDQYQQPFTTHPRTDVYVTSSSPHPGPKFGCTICHEGQGSGTGFSTASHTPNDPAQAIAWEHAHNYQSNHFWEFPMLPDRFTESTCIKCHHNVVELGENPKFGATAPKVVEGYNIVRQYGCFGCHEVNGFDGAKQIGPDLRLEPSTKEEMAKLAADPSANPGTMRKVGPALLHIGQKTTPAWTEYWTEVPQRFRPTTRMPSFFKQLDQHGQPVLNSKGELRQLEGQGDKEAEQLTPVEIASLTHYLFSKSTPIDLQKPDEDYKANAERGKTLFSRRGCLACHSHKDFPGAHADFGPDLSKVHDKLKPGEEGRNWLYSWIRDPERYHPRTKMPNLFLEKYKEKDETIDPAADIAAFLLEGGPGEYKEMKFDPAGLEFLAKLYLSKALTKAQVEEVFRDKRYPERNKENIKGDEIELFTEGDKRIDENMMLNYVGRRTISRYGCYGCHDISGFEKARPIGTALQNWGRKDSSKLAMEHIHEFLHHHGQPDGSSTAEAAESALKKALAHSYATPQEEAQGLSLAYFYEQVLHNNRVGFLWQKLRSPRSYDYKKIETKNYDERLRMPKFPFTPQQIEAVETFVLGLVAEPPAEQYVYHPKGPANDRIQGEKLLTKYNCTGCHMVDMTKISYAVDPESVVASALADGEYPEALPLLMKLKPPRKGETGGTYVVDGKELPVVTFHGLVNSVPDPEADVEDQEFGYDLWETLQIGEKVLFPSSRILVPAKQQVSVEAGRGGAFAEWLVDSLMKSDSNINRYLAWQSSPPPLYREGTKVQTPWLYHFLKNPYQLRHTTVLRMPQFNMSDAEAMQLANYFSAVDGSEYPYQDVPERQPEYLSVKEHEHKDYLQDSWKMLNAPLCIKCHSLGGRQYQSQNPATDIRGPNLESVPDRLRPEWTMLWLYKPQWITPYTSMPQPLPRNQKQFDDLFGGNGLEQTIAIRDALMNYHRLMEQQGKYVPPEPKGEAADNKQAQAAPPAAKKTNRFDDDAFQGPLKDKAELAKEENK